MSRARTPLSLGLAAALFAGAASLRARPADAARDAQTYEDIYYLPPTGWLTVMTLGYREAAADLLWSRALLYYADQLEHRAQGRNAMRYARDISALDPKFRPAYEWAGFIPFYLATADPDVELMERGVALMLEGTRQFPEDGQLAWDVAAAIRYEFLPHANLPADERQTWEYTAAVEAARAWRLGAAPDWAVVADDAAIAALGTNARGISQLRELIAVTRDPETRARAMEQLARLEDITDFQAHMVLQEHFEEEHSRDYPYMDADHYAVIGPRELPPSAP